MLEPKCFQGNYLFQILKQHLPADPAVWKRVRTEFWPHYENPAQVRLTFMIEHRRSVQVAADLPGNNAAIEEAVSP